MISKAHSVTSLYSLSPFNLKPANKVFTLCLSNILLCLTFFANHSSWALESDKYAQLQITADTAELDEQSGVATYQGSVVLKQGTLELNSDTLTITRNKLGVSKVIAKGSPATYRQMSAQDQPPAAAQATSITYFVAQGKVRLQGNAILQQGESRFEGEEIEYDMNKKTLTAGNPDDPSTGQPKQQRVKMILPPSHSQAEQ